MQIKMVTDHLILGKQIAWKILFFNIQYTYQGRSQDFEKGEANVTQGGAEGTYS